MTDQSLPCDTYECMDRGWCLIRGICKRTPTPATPAADDRAAMEEGVRGLTVHHEPVEFRAMPAEDCAGCSKPTRYWYEPADIAVCQQCAPKLTRKDLPTKAAWCKGARVRWNALLNPTTASRTP
jgi:hypothetical protein